MPVAQAKEQVHDCFAGGAVEIAGRLIGQKDRRPRHGGAGQRHALLFAARKLRRVVVEPCAKPHRRQFRRRPVEGIAHAGKFQRHGDIFEGGHCRNQVEGLEDDAHIRPAEAGKRVFVHRGQILPEGMDGARGRTLQPAEEHEE